MRLKQTRIDDEITLFTAGNSLVNAVLIEYDTILVCIDTLHLPADSKELHTHILSRNKPLKYLINTHGHSDHCFGNGTLHQQGTFIISHEKYAITNRAERDMLKISPSRIQPNKIMPPGITFSEDLFLPGCNLQIIHVPGHSPDSSVVFLTEKKMIIAGDTVLNSDSEKIAVPYFYWGDLDHMLVSLEKLLDLQPVLIIPGHGNPCTASVIERDMHYLQNFRRLMDEFIEMNGHFTVPQMKEMAYMYVGIEDCLPGTDKIDFWVPKMHNLNQERYIEWKIEGISVDTLAFPIQNDIDSI